MTDQVTVNSSSPDDGSTANPSAATVIHYTGVGFDALWTAVGIYAGPEVAGLIDTTQLIHSGTFSTLENLAGGTDTLFEGYAKDFANFFAGKIGQQLVSKAIAAAPVELPALAEGALSFTGIMGLGAAAAYGLKMEIDYIHAHDGDIIAWGVNHIGESSQKMTSDLQAAVTNANINLIDSEAASFTAAASTLTQDLTAAHGDSALTQLALARFQVNLTNGIGAALDNSLDMIGGGAVDNTSIHAQIAADLSGQTQSLNTLFASAFNSAAATSGAGTDPDIAAQAFDSYVSAHAGALSPDLATAAGVTNAVVTGHTTDLADGGALTPGAGGGDSLSLSFDQASSGNPTDTLIDGDGSAVITMQGLGGDSWQQITDSYNQFQQQIGEIETDKDGTLLDSAFDPTHGDALSSVTTTNPDGSSSYLGIDLDNANWKAFTASYNSDGQLVQDFQVNVDGSTSDIVYDPDHNGAIASIFDVNADQTSAFTQFDLDGTQGWSKAVDSFDASHVKTQEELFNDDNTTEIAHFDDTSDNSWKDYTDVFNPNGQLTARFQENDDGTTLDAGYAPDAGGALQSTLDTETNGNQTLTTFDVASDFFEQAIRVTNSAGQLLSTVILNNDGSGGAQTFDAVTGAMTQQTVVEADGSSVRQFFSSAGQWLHTLALDATGNVLSESFSPDISAAQLFAVVVDSLAGRTISQFVASAGLPVELAIKAFANSDLQSIIDSIGDNPVGAATTLLQAYGKDIADKVAGVVGQDAGQALFKAVGLTSGTELLIGGTIGKTATTDLTNFVVDNFQAIINGSVTQASLTSAFANFDVSVAQVGVTVVETYIDKLLGINKLGGDSTIGGDIGSAIGGAIGAYLGAAPLGSFIGKIVGSIIGSFFGHPSVGPNAVAFDEYNTTTKMFGLTQSGADNGGDVTIARGMVNAAAGDENMILTAIGGHISGTVGPVSLGYFKGQFFYAPGKVNPDPFPNAYSDANLAVDKAVTATFDGLQMQGGNPFMEYVLLETTATSAQMLVNQLDAAHDYGLYNANPIAFDAGVLLSGDITQFQAWQQELALAQTLGLDKLKTSGTNTVSATDTAAGILAHLPNLQKLAHAGQLTAVTVADSAANIAANRTALQNDVTAHQITAVDVVSDTVAHVVSNLSTLQSMASAHALTGISIKDTASNVAANFTTLESLAASGLLASVTFTDNFVPFFTLSTAQWAGDTALLSKFADSYQLSIQDSAANVHAQLSALETLAQDGKLIAIHLTDAGTPNIALTKAQFDGDAAVLGKIATPFSIGVSGVAAADAFVVAASDHVVSLSIADTAFGVAFALDALQPLSSIGKINAITLADPADPMPITADQLTRDTSALSKISGSYALEVLHARAMDAASLGVDPRVATLTIDDSVDQIDANSALLGRLEGSGKISFTTASDSAANVTAGLSTLSHMLATGLVQSVELTDGATATLSLTAVQLAADANVLDSMATHFALAETGQHILLSGHESLDIVGSNNVVMAGTGVLFGISGSNNAVEVDTGDGIFLVSQHGIADPFQDFGSDAVLGTDGDDELSGGAGIDALVGLGGDDTFVAPGLATGGTVTVWGGGDLGGSGFDTVDYSGTAGALQIVLGEGEDVHGAYGWVADSASHYLAQLHSIDGATGGAGDDAISGNANNNVIAGGGGDNWLSGGGGNDRFIAPGAAGGTDTVFGGTISRPDGADTVDYSGYGNALTVDLALGSDSSGILGSVTSGGRTLANLHGIGGAIGGAGNDTMISGAGNDIFTGGGGADHFVFSPGSGGDTITDFAAAGPGNDIIEIDIPGITSFIAVKALMSQSGGDTIISLDAQDHIVLQHMQANQLTAADFVFG